MPVAFWFELYSRDRGALMYFLRQVQEKINPLLISKWVRDVPSASDDKRLGFVAIQTYRQNIHVQLTNIAYHDPFMMGVMFQSHSIMNQVHRPIPQRMDVVPSTAGQHLSESSSSSSGSSRAGGGESSTSTVVESSHNVGRASSQGPQGDSGGARGRDKRPSPESDTAESTQGSAKRPRHNDTATEAARSRGPPRRRTIPLRVLPLQYSTSGSQPADCQRQDHEHNTGCLSMIRLPAVEDRRFPIRLAVLNSILNSELNSDPISAPNSVPDSAPDSVQDNVPNSVPDSAPQNAPDTAPESAPESASDTVPNSPPNNSLNSIPGQAQTQDTVTAEQQCNPVCMICKRAGTTWTIDALDWLNRGHQGLITCPDCALAPENFREVNVMYRGPMVQGPMDRPYRHRQLWIYSARDPELRKVADRDPFVNPDRTAYQRVPRAARRRNTE